MGNHDMFWVVLLTVALSPLVTWLIRKWPAADEADETVRGRQLLSLDEVTARQQRIGRPFSQSVADSTQSQETAQ